MTDCYSYVYDVLVNALIEFVLVYVCFNSGVQVGLLVRMVTVLTALRTV